jgi:hypothetical protein
MTPEETHLETHLNNLRILFTKAAAPVNALKAGEHIPLTKLSEDLAKEMGGSDSKVYPAIRAFFEGYPNTTMKSGRDGGIYKLPLNEKTKKEEAVNDAR